MVAKVITFYCKEGELEVQIGAHCVATLRAAAEAELLAFLLERKWQAETPDKTSCPLYVELPAYGR